MGLKTTKTNPLCLVCNSNQFSSIYSDTLLKCQKCDFITANLDVDKDLLEKIYTENYFMGEEYLNYLEEKPALQKNFKKNLKRLTKKGFLYNPRNVLEIGCSYGFFGEIVKQNFPEANYHGIDVVKEACNHAQNLISNSKIFCDDYLSRNFGQQFDHVFMWDVIEHLKHPDKFIRKIHQELKREGKLFITTGDIATPLPKIQKEKWRLIHPPSHLHYFSKKTLSKLLEDSGFKILNIYHPCIYRSARQIFYSIFMLRKKHTKITEKTYSLIPKNIFLPLNTFDIILISAQKI